MQVSPKRGRKRSPKSAQRSAKLDSARSYAKFKQINGKHSFRPAVKNGYVDYQARKRKGGKVGFFNFELAKEMGLIPKDHPENIPPALSKIILDTFSLVIINEYDIQKKKKYPKNEIKENKYMATRYLQLQHPDKTGKTSGDGRSIWNGEVTHKGCTWDISSCGTGATRLSPASAIQGKMFKTGDKQVSYGCGYNDLEDALYAAITSEIFHRSGIPTERTLAIIEFPGKLAISVRAAKSLLRPSHFFHHLKQGNFEGLKSAVDYYYHRQTQNENWPKLSGKKKYEYFAEQMALNFSRVAARFESDYIFVWMDWDGDNILMDGGIIDYGSVRQFGLYHYEYRYDDVDRFSTNIPEQKLKARYIAQTFAQIRDFIVTGQKRNIKEFENDSIIKLFDKNFEVARNEFLLYKTGLNQKCCEYLLNSASKCVEDFRKVFSYFEKTKSKKGVYKVADGVTCDATYCMRDILRELPRHLLLNSTPLNAEAFTEICASSYAKYSDIELTPYKRKRIEELQDLYFSLVKKAAQHFKKDPKHILREVSSRSSIINRYDRITGDGVLTVTEVLMRERKNLPSEGFHEIINAFIRYQILVPARKKAKNRFFGKRPSKVRSLFNRTIDLIKEYRESF